MCDGSFFCFSIDTSVALDALFNRRGRGVPAEANCLQRALMMLPFHGLLANQVVMLQ